MSGFTLLWGKILDSSIWVKETKETRLVWITLLAMKDKEGNVQSSEIGLADRAKVSPEECRKALKILLSPDPDDTSKVEKGVRIRVIPGGWQVVNHDLYRFSTEARRELWRQQKAEQRLKSKKQHKPGVKLPGEMAHEAALKRGASQEELDRLAEPVRATGKAGIQSMPAGGMMAGEGVAK
jgi:hypothetical protein